MKTKFIALAFSVNMLLAGVSHASEMDEIATHLKSGDFSVVQEKLVPLAKKGDARAEFNLGVAYMYGNGVPKDEKLAFYWTEKSAKKGFGRAEMNLASHYQTGKGTAQNLNKALKWYEIAKNDPEVAENAKIKCEELKSFISGSNQGVTTASAQARGNNN